MYPVVTQRNALPGEPERVATGGEGRLIRVEGEETEHSERAAARDNRPHPHPHPHLHPHFPQHQHHQHGAGDHQNPQQQHLYTQQQEDRMLSVCMLEEEEEEEEENSEERCLQPAFLCLRRLAQEGPVPVFGFDFALDVREGETCGERPGVRGCAAAVSQATLSFMESTSSFVETILPFMDAILTYHGFTPGSGDTGDRIHSAGDQGVGGA
eukprot:3932550-Rhodomonas_salina.2